METSKETIVIIEGAKYMRSEIKIIQKLIVWFYKIHNVIPRYTPERSEWVRHLEKESREILYFDWSGRAWPRSVNRAARELTLFLEGRGPVKIITVSLGAQIAIKASQHARNIVKIISLSGVYTPRPISVPFVDIYSPSDRFASACRAFLSALPVHGKMERKEVILRDMRHDQFNDDAILADGEFKGVAVSGMLEHFLEA